MAKAKQTRKQLLKRDDAFLSAANQSAEWAKDNKIALIAGSTAVVVVIAAIWGGAEYVRIRNIKASTLFEQALKLHDDAVILGSAEASEPGETADPAAPTFATEADKEKAVLEKLQAVVDEAGSAGVGALARLYIANLHAKREENEEAEKAFATLVDKLSTTDSVYFLAVERTAYLQEKRGDKNAAIETIGRLTANDNVFYADYAAFNQGRLYQELGEKDRARGLFERIEKDFPESPTKQEVERRLDQIGRTPAPTPSSEEQPAPGTDEVTESAPDPEIPAPDAKTQPDAETAPAGEDAESSP